MSEKHSDDCMGIIKIGWSEEFVMPIEDALGVMKHFRSARKLVENEGIPGTKPLSNYPEFRLMPMVTYNQIKVIDVLDTN